MVVQPPVAAAEGAASTGQVADLAPASVAIVCVVAVENDFVLINTAQIWQLVDAVFIHALHHGKTAYVRGQASCGPHTNHAS